MNKTATTQNRECLAAAVHDSWSNWMRHVFSKATHNPDGSWTIPAESADRWQRQIATSYSLLSETEKDSDREQADRLLAVIENSSSRRTDHDV